MFYEIVFYGILNVLICQTIAVNDDYKLEFVQIIYRHGERAPTGHYRTDPNPDSVWPLGLGALTLIGRKQHYSLGKLFKKMYQDFYTTKPTEVEAYSTDYDRCLTSAQANFASFFAPSKEWQFDENFVWQPIPVSSIPSLIDNFLGSRLKYCPKFLEERFYLNNSAETRALNSKYKKLFDYLTRYSGTHIKTFVEAMQLYDTLHLEKKYNLTIPNWVAPIWNELQEVADAAPVHMYNSTVIQRLQAGPFLMLVNTTFDQKIKGGIPHLKFRVYSSRDANVGTTLMALNRLPPKLVPYCATIIFELYSNAEEDRFVRMLYLNTTSDDKFNQTPHVYNMDTCPEYCPYEQFVSILTPFSTVEYDFECNKID